MSISSAKKILTILICAFLISPSSAIAAGRSANVVNTILSGSGVPESTVGVNGDFYIDLKSMNFYGPKKIIDGHFQHH